MSQASSDLTRRAFVQVLAGAASIAAWPFGARAQVSPVMATLAAYMSQAGTRALPGAVVLKTKNHILDTLAAAISGAQLPPGIQALKFAEAYGG